MNAARAALTRAVNRAIAEGAPVYVDLPAREVGFSFDQLSPAAKKFARQGYEIDHEDDSWWDSTYEDADTIAAMMGIEIKRKHHTTYSGQIITGPQIWFSGFASQGDGACFEGNWYPSKDPFGSLCAVMSHAPQDDVLHEIAFALADMSERCNALIPDASIHVERSSSSYCNSGCTRMWVELPTPEALDEGNKLQLMTWNALCDRYRLVYIPFEEESKAVLRSFMDWIYRQLEAEHDYLTSDAAIDEALADFTFDEDGNTIG